MQVVVVDVVVDVVAVLVEAEVEVEVEAEKGVPPFTAQMAARKRHCCRSEALAVAAEMGAYRTVLTHLSQRRRFSFSRPSPILLLPPFFHSPSPALL